MVLYYHVSIFGENLTKIFDILLFGFARGSVLLSLFCPFGTFCPSCLNLQLKLTTPTAVTWPPYLCERLFNNLTVLNHQRGLFLGHFRLKFA